MDLNIDKAFELFSLDVMTRCSCSLCSCLEWDREKIDLSNVPAWNSGLMYFTSPSYFFGNSQVVIRCYFNYIDKKMNILYLSGCPRDSGVVLNYEREEVMEKLSESERDIFIFNLDLFT